MSTLPTPGIGNIQDVFDQALGQAGIAGAIPASTQGLIDAQLAAAQTQVDAALGQFASFNPGTPLDPVNWPNYPVAISDPISAGPVPPPYTNGNSGPPTQTGPSTGGGGTGVGSGSSAGGQGKPGGTVGTTRTGKTGKTVTLSSGGTSSGGSLVLLLGLGIGAYLLIGHRKGVERWLGGRA